jgi:hypothetical protein
VSRIVGWFLKNKSVVFLATLLFIGSGVSATTRLNQELFQHGRGLSMRRAHMLWAKSS